MKFAAELCMARLIYLGQKGRGISLKIPKGGYKNVIECQVWWNRDHIGLVLTTVGPWSGYWSHPLPYSIIMVVKQSSVMLPMASWSFSCNHDSAVLTCEHCWWSTTNQEISLKVSLYLCVGGNSICRIKVDPSEPALTCACANCRLHFHHTALQLQTWLNLKMSSRVSINYLQDVKALPFPPPRSALHCESGSCIPPFSFLLWGKVQGRRLWELLCLSHYVISVLPHLKSTCEAPLMIGSRSC